MNQDQTFMQRTMDLALKAKGKTSPNPMVGAVIVKNHKVIAEGWHKRCGGPHAEIIALKGAGKKAKGSILYVNLEPCFHHGRTGPCVDAIIASGLRKVVIGTRDPNPLTNGKSIRKMKRYGIVVKEAVLEQEASNINEIFNKYIRKKMPYVVAKTAQSLDGKIALSSGASKWITSQQTRDFARKKRNEFDAIMVGVETILKDNPFLDAADSRKKIIKIVCDSKLRIPLKTNLWKKASVKQCLIATTTQAPLKKIKQLQKKGVCIVVCPQKQGRVNLEWFMEECAKRQLSSVLIEGGAKLIGSALKQGLIDKMHIYMAPRIIGDDLAKSSITGLKPKSLSEVIDLKNMRGYFVGKDLFFEGIIKKRS